MSLHPLAGKPAPYELLVNVPRLISAYYTAEPDMTDPAQNEEHASAHQLVPALGSRSTATALRPSDLRWTYTDS